MANEFKARFYSGIGSQGPQGPKGDTGATGPTGPIGPAGPYYTPAVSSNGDLSWTNNGGLTNPASVNLTDKFVGAVADVRSAVEGLDADTASLQAKMDDVQTAIAEAEAAVAGIEDQRDDMIQAIADAAELGVDTTLSTANMAPDSKVVGDEVAKLKKSLAYYNNRNLLDDLEHNELTYNGLTYTWADDGSCHIEGTVSGSSSYVMMFNSTSKVPANLVPSKTYTVKYSGNKARLRIGYYDTAWHNFFETLTDTTVTIPAAAVGLRIQIITLTRDTVVNETVWPIITEVKSETQKSLERSMIDAASTGDVNDLATVFHETTGNAVIEMTGGGYVPCNTLTGIDVTVVTPNANYRHAVVACAEGDAFTVSAKGASIGRAWAIVDEDGNRLDSATAGQTVSNLTLVMPAGAKWLIINDNNTNTRSYYGKLLKVSIEDIENAEDVAAVVVPLMKPAADIAYSWWVKNRAVGDNGTLYFTYISSDAMAGVACRFADGTIRRKDLYKASSCDDHNAPGVCIVDVGGEKRVCVVGPTGHNASRRIHVYLAAEADTIMCNFVNRTSSMTCPTGYFYANSYAQVFYANGVIYDVFRVKQAVSSTSEVLGICWVCAKSSDLGQTWQIYRLMRINSQKLDYIWLEDVEGSDTLKRIILQRNASATPLKPIRAGFVDLASNAVYDNAMNSLEKPMLLVPGNELIYRDNVVCAEYDDFTKIIDEETGYRIRVLDVWDSGDSNLEFLYARTAVADDQTDFILYKYENGTSIEIAHIGRPFCTTSLYVTGACFSGDSNTVVYSKNDSETNDGKHSLHEAKLADGAVVSDTVLRRSKQLIARPARYDDGGVMYLVGKYNGVSGAEYTSWDFSVAFL